MTEPLRAVTVVLERFSVESLEVPTADLAVQVAVDLPVDLIVLCYPIDGTRIDHFVARIRRAELADRGTRVVLLADAVALPRIARHTDEVMTVLAADQRPDELERQLEDHLRRAPRLRGRKMVKIEGETGTARVRRYLQTENISESGMFVRMSEPLQPGTRFRFELALSADTPAIKGTAEVTRIARHDEGRSGIGVRFARLDLHSRRRLREFVENELHADRSVV